MGKTFEREKIDAKVRRFRLTKRSATGEVFEVLEGGDDRPTRVLYRKDGIAPAESYAPMRKEE